MDRCFNILHGLACCIGLISAVAFSNIPENFKSPATTKKASRELRSEDMLKNRASHVDHAGLNVNVCLEVIARVKGIRRLEDFAEWSSWQAGGSWPGKLRKQFDEFVHLNPHGDTDPSPTLRQNTDEGRDGIACLFDWIRDGPVAVSYYGGPTSIYLRRVYSVVVVLDLDTKGDRAKFYDPNWKEELGLPLTDFVKRIADTDGKVWAYTVVR